MAFSSSLLYFLSLLFLPILSSPTTITIPLTNSNTKISAPSQYHNLNYLASLSRNRAHHLKTPKIHPVSSTSLFPRSYGGYSISLSFGTPPQTIPFVMDTGSDFVWFPCTRRYTCRNCSFPATKPPSAFIPKQSSTSKVLGCLNKKCGWVHNNPDVQSRCSDCVPDSKNCSQICPPYLIVYGSGSTGGISIVDNLNLPGKRVPDFLVGCSLFSSRQPAGVAGFGRGPTQVKDYKRVKEVETLSGLRPCFNISSHRKVMFPEMKFHFKGGAEMLLPTVNYFSFVSDELEVVCLTMVTDATAESTGPAIILGNYQLQNFYTEFDLGNERFGFRKQLCL